MTTKPSNPSTEDVTIDSVMQALTTWRENKTNPAESIPDDIWDDIFIIADKYSVSSVRRLLGINSKQYQLKLEQRGKTTPTSSPELSRCKVTSATPVPLPEVIMNTIVVEFCRADGRVMKIHTTEESFKKLIDDFYAEE